MRRIYILGSVGSGKSRLGKLLGEKLDIKHYDLDDIYWEKKFSKRRKVQERKKKFESLLKKRSWIIEGVYGSWIEKALKRSDKVVLLDYAVPVLIWRIWGKVWRNKTLNDFFKLVSYALDYKKNKESSYGLYWHKKIIKRNKSDYILIKNNRDLEDFVRKLK